MTLNQILYFQTVARHQHFRLAAAELSISQPSLSRSIAVLEEELGIILFERKGRTVTLTKYGKLFLEHADRILDEVRLINIGNELSMTLSIGVGVNGGSYTENYESARVAMDLALGRGGDQAVVRDGDAIPIMEVRPRKSKRVQE